MLIRLTRWDDDTDDADVNDDDEVKEDETDVRGEGIGKKKKKRKSCSPNSWGYFLSLVSPPERRRVVWGWSPVVGVHVHVARR